jgi:methionyl aminopeptidase
LRSSYAKQLLKYIEDNFRTLPFAERWLQNVVPRGNYGEAFRELLSAKCLMQYPVFVEASGKTVAQAEHTVLVVEDGCAVLT